MSTSSIQQAIDVFKKGGVVIFPTDTAYGIGCRMDNEASVRKVFKAKRRRLSNPLLVLVDSIKMAEKYVKFDPRSLALVKKYWPGGLTIFLPCDLEKVPNVVRADMNTLAVRWPKHKIMEKIISEVGVPIIATSANISGESTPYSLEQVDKKILDQVDFVLDGECTYKQESTIIDCSVTSWKIIREGAVEVNFQYPISNIQYPMTSVTLKIDTSNNLTTRVELVLNKKTYKIEEKRGKPGDQNVLELVEKLLKKQGATLKDINSVEVNAGPGSFTGLRVGASIANALAFSLGISVNGKPAGEIVEPTY